MENLDRKVFSVSEINLQVKDALELSFEEYIFVEGEISQATRAQSGHVYLTLKDEISSVRCTLWNARLGRINIQPEIGLQVIIRCKVSFYEKNGSYQLDIVDIKSASEGKFHESFERLKNKLKNEGLFDINFKKELPKYPKSIAVITSLSGSVYQDIIKVIKRRLPSVEIEIYGCNVQGDNCAKSIIKQLICVNKKNSSDIIIIARGGGSLEDLIDYNDEFLARQIYSSEIPIITAVGHETDTTIVDLVSDLRAATPSEAAEIATEISSEDMLNYLNDSSKRIENLIINKLKDIKHMLSNKKNIIEKNNPITKINSHNQTIDILVESLKSRLQYTINNKKNLKQKMYLKLIDFNPENKINLIESKLSSKKHEIETFFNNILISNKNLLKIKSNTIHDINPLAILDKGFSLVYSNNKISNKVRDFKIKDQVKIKVSDGEVISKVEKTRKY
tara:strand:- start:494 stop:1840 length:1347 start_codon:yes stop_codon:yes gene_type:complete